MKILFVSSEGLPFSKTGGLADVVEALPKALAEMGHEVAVLLPRYHGTKASKVVLPSLTISLGTHLRFPSIVDGSALNGVRYFFVDDPVYFDRPSLYGERGLDYPDNAQRFALFSKAAIELAKQVWKPDVFHCHDWQSALVPTLLRTQHADDPAVEHIPVIFTVHNLGYHGYFERPVLETVGLPASLFGIDGLEFYGRVNFLKGGLLFADYLTTVSRKYAEEIQTPEYGHGLDGVIRSRAKHLVGILNGVDYSAWSPENDTFIAAQYSARDLSGKEACKKDLLAEFKLPASNLTRPLMGIVSRFADQKGFDLIEEAARRMMKKDLALVALGNGEPKYETLFLDLAKRFPQRVGVQIAYDNALAHKIEAGADMFLMPSRYEPCGLNQIYSLRYGTVPVVRATGGLDDTIEPFNAKTGKGTGFKFEAYTGEALLDCVDRALAAYRNPEAWRKLQQNGMAKDFSWKASATQYAKLYETARKGRIPRAAGTSN